MVSAVLAVVSGLVPGAASKLPTQQEPTPPLAVLTPLVGTVDTTDPRAVARRILPPLRAPALGPRVGVVVADVTPGGDGLGTVAVSRGADRRYRPASTVKLLTAAAALETLGPTHRFRTRTVLLPPPDARVPRLVLVGSGDPTLGRRAVASLARRTALALRSAGVAQVRVLGDTSLFRQPVNPAWEPGYIAGGFASPVHALAMDAGGLGPLPTTAVLAQRLRAAGVDVVGAPRLASAGAQAALAAGTELAAHESPPLRGIVEDMLTTSDNRVAELLARSVSAAAGGPGDAAAAAAATLDVVQALGVDTQGARLLDGSGLARGNRLDADLLVQLVALAVAPDRSSLDALHAGLPVAGATGTLALRMTTSPAAGRVRAKTGTLRETTALAGLVVDAAGRQYAFAVLADAVNPAQPFTAQQAVDAAVSRLAGGG